MFRMRLTPHTAQEPIEADDGLGFSRDSWGDPRPVMAYLCGQSAAAYESNEFGLRRFDATLVTEEVLPPRTLIDGSWVTDEPVEARSGTFACGLTRFGGDDGR